jgi:hypothetical protein
MVEELGPGHARAVVAGLGVGEHGHAAAVLVLRVIDLGSASRALASTRNGCAYLCCGDRCPIGFNRSKTALMTACLSTMPGWTTSR